MHVVLDVTNCASSDVGTDELVAAMRETAGLLGCQVLGELPVSFQPHGSTVVLVLAESHMAVSTWPEYRLAHVDILTCRMDRPIAEAVVPVLEALRAGDVHSQEISRRGPVVTGSGGAG